MPGFPSLWPPPASVSRLPFLFVLIPLLHVRSLQAFAAGAALCSTSLGTTFTILSTCGLVTTRLGTVLTTAAMMDDVVGLIMVQVVSNLGQSGGIVDVGTVLRPIGCSIAVVVLLILMCRCVALPLRARVLPRLRPQLKSPNISFVLQSLFLVSIFTGATYAGTSGLFAAYLAGATLVWWNKTAGQHSCISTRMSQTDPVHSVNDGFEIYASRYAAITNLLLKSLFFASIGFSVPISRMFRGAVVWRGIVYALLMLASKLNTSLWLIRGREDMPFTNSKRVPKSQSSLLRKLVPRLQDGRTTAPVNQHQHTQSSAQTSIALPLSRLRDVQVIDPSSMSAMRVESSPQPSPETLNAHAVAGARRSHVSTLYSPCLRGLAMTARGEIGYLIVSVAQSSGVFSSTSQTGQDPDVLLVVIWAVRLCTLIGPVAVGLLIRHIRRSEKERDDSQGHYEALGK